MADVKFETTRLKVSTAAAGNTFDITISGFGTPKAAMFFINRAEEDDTQAANGGMSYGFTDGSKDVSCGGSSKDAVTTSDTWRWHRFVSGSEQCIAVTTAAGSNFDGRASFNSWITDGVRLDIDEAFGTDFLLTCVLIGGADVSNVKANFVNMGTGSGAHITDLGFLADVVFTATNGSGTYGSNIESIGISSFGVSHNTGTDTNHFIGMWDVDAQGTSNTGCYTSNSYCVGQVYNGVANWRGYITTYDTAGFNYVTDTSANGDYAIYLAIKFDNSPNIKVVNYNPPQTTTGSNSITGAGFTPTFGLLGMSNANTVNTANSSDCGYGVATFDAGGFYTTSSSIDDNVTTMKSKCVSSDHLLTHKDGDVVDREATFTAFNSDGCELNYSTADALARRWWAFFIEGVAPAVSITVDLASLPATSTSAGVSPTVVKGSLSLDLSTFSADATSGAVDPTTLLGSITIDLANFYADSTATAESPVVDFGSLTIDLSSAFADATSSAVGSDVFSSSITIDLSGLTADVSSFIVDPTVIHGSLAIDLSSDWADSTSTAVSPEIEQSSITIDLSSVVATVTGTAVDPVLGFGSITLDLSTLPATSTSQALLTDIINGSITIDLSSLSANATADALFDGAVLGSVTLDLSSIFADSTSGAVDPTVDAGAGIDISPTEATSNVTTLLGDVIFGSLSIDLSTTIAETTGSATDPTAEMGSLLLGGYQAEATTAAVFDTVLLGSITLDLSGVSAEATSDSLIDSIIYGSITLDLSTNYAELSSAAVDPTVDIGGGTPISITPDNAFVEVDALFGTVIKGSLSISPVTADSTSTGLLTDVIFGSITINLSTVSAESTVSALLDGVVLGSTTAIVDPANANTTALIGNVDDGTVVAGTGDDGSNLMMVRSRM